MDDDPMAAHAAEAMIFDVLNPRPHGTTADRPQWGARQTAEQIVGQFRVTYVREHGLRRLMMIGPAEVDPAALR
jgi:hypothetical protein